MFSIAVTAMAWFILAVGLFLVCATISLLVRAKEKSIYLQNAMMEYSLERAKADDTKPISADSLVAKTYSKN